MPIIHISDAADPRIADYVGVSDPGLLRRRGLFVAENRLVVRALLASSRFRARSVLVTDAAFASLEDVLAPATGGPSPLDVYICPKDLMEPISGYDIHRGCLALGERPAPVAVGAVLGSLPDARRIVVLEAMTNADNVGAIFRNARAFGVDAVLIGPRCCDPLYRKAIRVSLGATLVVPFATVETTGRPPFDEAQGRQEAGRVPVGASPRVGPLKADLLALQRAGFTLVALTPAADAVDLDEFAASRLPSRLALVVGNEGEGLSREALGACDVRVRIAMAPGVDSLNASTATGIALHRIFAR